MLRVLTYHRIAQPGSGPGLNPRLISATPAGFEQQIHHIASHFHPISVEEVLLAQEHERPLPRRSVLVTFDDAYRDFGQIAWPILKNYRIPVTLFVPTAFPNHPKNGYWWDRIYESISNPARRELEIGSLGRLSLESPLQRRKSLRSIESPIKSLSHTEAMNLVEAITEQLGGGQKSCASVLGWDELRVLARDGTTLAAHTRTHPILTQLPLKQAREEIVGSQEDLRREIGTTLPVFCYPNGAYNKTIVETLKREGFRLAFTTLRGQNKIGSTDPLRLCRTNITPRTTLPIFHLRLYPLGGLFRQVASAKTTLGKDELRMNRSAIQGRSSRPLRAAYIMSRFPKLTETFILYEILAMEALGLEV